MIKSRDFILIFLLAFLWSFTFIFIRIGVDSVDPVTLTFYRLCYAFAFVLIVALVKRAKVFSYKRYTWKLIASSFLLNAFPFTLCAIGEVTIDGSTTGIIEGATPFFAAFFAWFVFKKRSICYRQIRAFVMGFLGLLVVFYPFIKEGAFSEFWGIAALLGMAVSFAFGFNFTEKYLREVPPIEAITIQLFFAPIMLLPFAILEQKGLATIPMDTHTILAFLGITSSLGWITYFYAIKNTSAVNVSVATMITPIITILWGWLFLDEPITWNKVLGTIIVLGALSILWNFHGACIEHIIQRHKRK